MLISFDAEPVRALLDVTMAANHHVPTFTQIVMPQYWRADLCEERRKLLDSEYARDGFAISATAEDVDPAKVGPGLWLVGDHGIYLMCNMPSEDVRQAGIQHVVYARQANPETMAFEEWYQAKRDIFGADDGVEFLSAESVEAVLAQCGNTFEIEIDRDHLIIAHAAQAGPDHF